MATRKKSTSAGGSVITVDKKTRRDYHIDESLEAGIALEGWEVKALRAGRVQLRDSYVMLKNGEAFLVGGMITPLPAASTHIEPNPRRQRKLLLHRRELDRLIGAVERKGATVVALSMYWKKGRAKLELGIAKGKKQHDKRADEKERDWQREKGRILKHG